MCRIWDAIVLGRCSQNPNTKHCALPKPFNAHRRARWHALLPLPILVLAHDSSPSPLFVSPIFLTPQAPQNNSKVAPFVCPIGVAFAFAMRPSGNAARIVWRSWLERRHDCLCTCGGGISHMPTEFRGHTKGLRRGEVFEGTCGVGEVWSNKVVRRLQYGTGQGGEGMPQVTATGGTSHWDRGGMLPDGFRATGSTKFASTTVRHPKGYPLWACGFDRAPQRSRYRLLR